MNKVRHFFTTVKTLAQETRETTKTCTAKFQARLLLYDTIEEELTAHTEQRDRQTRQTEGELLINFNSIRLC